ncbi:Ser/Thr protein kinase RdoA involved in Cpx stress response, MazF antagonist [Paenibacillus sp. 1_12]|uniref:phosphotransferase n=1 Tax=Paenibacillus sp. 1_12 TaxID=1566278 RepID=UPI0008E0127C|nr:phosphotransferase [Paenibacillus sp. 1_12]SFK94708.1 Ser/Thr protein kinase RdoA involved in Cpx stress response, MazF antagonist [Paenibacillus sp. 1_12]
MGNSKFSMNEDYFNPSLICKQFRLGRFHNVGGSLGGSFNTNVKIETSEGAFVVRILNENNTMKHLRYVRKVLSMLRKQGLPVLEPILAMDGDPFISCKGKLLQVSSFVTIEPFQCRESQVYNSAQSLRAYHQALEHMHPGPKPSWSFYRSSFYYAEAIDRLRSLDVVPQAELSYIEIIYENLSNKWERVEASLPEAILHGDWHFWNLGYTKDEVSCVMDFDFMQQGKRIHDIAYALWVIYVLLPEYASTFDRAFIEGYGQLTDEEKGILPVAVARIALFFLCQSAYASNPSVKWDKHFPRQKPLIQWLASEGAIRLEEITRTAAYQTSPCLIEEPPPAEADQP